MIRTRQHLEGKKQRIKTLTDQCSRVLGMIAVLAVVVCTGATLLVISNDRKATAADHLPEIAVQENSNLVYDASQLQPGQSRMFTYPVNSSGRVRLLVSRDSKGTTRVAFASCTACYRFRNQHYLREGKLICGQCEQTMRIGDPGEKLATGRSCVAVPVPFSIENKQVIVRAQSITEGTKAFADVASLAKSAGSSKPVVE
jgi:uncharacterized membrane protein